MKIIRIKIQNDSLLIDKQLLGIFERVNKGFVEKSAPINVTV